MGDQEVTDIASDQDSLLESRVDSRERNDHFTLSLSGLAPELVEHFRRTSKF